jgi:hypothetical protein
MITNLKNIAHKFAVALLVVTMVLPMSTSASISSDRFFLESKVQEIATLLDNMIDKHSASSQEPMLETNNVSFQNLQASMDSEDYFYRVTEGITESSMPVPIRGDGNLDAHGFRFSCIPTHFAYDDPVVYPGEPGRAHLHMFYGNADVRYDSTSESIINSGASSCGGGITNRSAYWVPTLFTEDDEPVLPAKIILYYKSWVSDRSDIQPVPAGLQILANENILGANAPVVARPNTPSDTWGTPFRVTDGVAGHIDSGVGIAMTVNFPNCLAVDDNGDPILTSPGGTSHVAYGGASCPSSHPYTIPTLTQNIYYADVPYESDWYLASDVMNDAPKGTTLHADYMAGWTEESAEIMADCIRRGFRECGPPPLPEEALNGPDGNQIFEMWSGSFAPGADMTPDAMSGWPAMLHDHDMSMPMPEPEPEPEPEPTPTPSPIPTPVAGLTSGDLVTTIDVLNVRETPGLTGTLVGTQQAESVGTVRDTQPVIADGFAWVAVNFNSGADGWVVTEFLNVSSGTPVNSENQSELLARIQELLAEVQRLQAALAERDAEEVVDVVKDESVADEQQPKEESKPEPKPKEEPKSEPKPAPKQEPKTEKKPEIKPTQKTESKPEAKVEPAPKPEEKPEPISNPEPKTGANIINDTPGQDNLKGTDGDDYFIMSGSGSRWAWDGVYGWGGTDYVEMPASLSDYESVEASEFGSYVFITNKEVGTVNVHESIEFLVFPEGTYTVEEAAAKVK